MFRSWSSRLSWSSNILNTSIHRLPFHLNWKQSKMNTLRPFRLNSLHWNVNGGRNTFGLVAGYYLDCREANICKALKFCHSFWEAWWNNVVNWYSETCLVGVSLILRVSMSKNLSNHLKGCCVLLFLCLRRGRRPKKNMVIFSIFNLLTFWIKLRMEYSIASRIWHSYWFQYKQISEYIGIKKIIRRNIRIYLF